MQKNPYSGKFIAFDGIDGCGKTTQCEKALRYMLAGGERILRVKEPNKAIFGGKLIYGLLFERGPVGFSSMSSLQRQSHYFFNRMRHYLEVVIPALKEGINVLSDRSLASICFDAHDSGDLEVLLSAEAYYFQMEEVPFIRPDLVIVFDVTPEIAIQRLSEKDERRRDFFEQPEKLLQTRRAYQEFADKFGDFCQIIDASENANEVFFKFTRKLLHGIFPLREWKLEKEGQDGQVC